MPVSRNTFIRELKLTSRMISDGVEWKTEVVSRYTSIFME